MKKPAPLTKRITEAQRRQEIMDSAAKCFMLRGYYATTIDQIASLHGSTKGLIYYYFMSKADLFFEVYRLAMDRTIARALPILQEDGLGVSRLWRLCEAHILGIMGNLPYHHVAKQGVEIHLQSALTPEQKASLRELFKLRDEYEQIFVTVLEAGARDGTLAYPDGGLAAKTVLGALNSVSTWYRPREAQSQQQRAQMAARLTDIIVSGVRCLARGEVRESASEQRQFEQAARSVA